MHAFKAEYKPKYTRPDEPILIGRHQSQARVSIAEAKRLLQELQSAITTAEHVNMIKGNSDHG